MSPSEPPKLTYLITGLQYGGANIGMVRLLSGLPPDEFDITVVSLADTSKDVVPLLPEYVEVHELDLQSKVAIHKLRPLNGLISDTDILVCSLPHATFVGTLLAAVHRVPTVLVWQHNTVYSNSFRKALYKLAYFAADHVLADSESVQEMLVEDLGVPRKKVSSLPIAGIDPEFYRPIPTEDDASIRVGTIGRLSPQKGYFDLLECAERLADGIEFHIIGQGSLRDKIEAKAPENVTLHGDVDDDELPRLLASMDIYFQPSHWEGLCMTVIEAMACGLPVVGSRVGGITESVVHGETGYLCTTGDIDCFCRHLEILAGDRELRRKMGSAGRERAVTRYSKSALVEAFREAIKQTKTV